MEKLVVCTCHRFKIGSQDNFHDNFFLRNWSPATMIFQKRSKSTPSSTWKCHALRGFAAAATVGGIALLVASVAVLATLAAPVGVGLGMLLYGAFPLMTVGGVAGAFVFE